MNVLISSVGVSMYAACGLPISVILFMMILMALGRASMFGKNTNIVAALCTTFLCMLGLYQLFVASSVDENGVADDSKVWLACWLLPFTVLALAVLSLFLVLLLKKMFSAGSRRDPPPTNAGNTIVTGTRPLKASQDGPPVR